MKTPTSGRRPRSKKNTVTAAPPPSSLIVFPEVKDKVLERVDLKIDEDEESYLELLFQDQTALVFVVQQHAGITVTADYGKWKAGNWNRIKSWPPFF
jgi:hypothetical protein